ncbi:hypothetical protein BC940DRAFT_309539 [Gongronella butleri]|nr:hypothetical protein BC940DRAFT_309539 [Gongronella butleri]
MSCFIIHFLAFFLAKFVLYMHQRPAMSISYTIGPLPSPMQQSIAVQTLSKEEETPLLFINRELGNCIGSLSALGLYL